MTQAELIEIKKDFRLKAESCFGTIEILMNEIKEREQMIRRMEEKAVLYNKQAQEIADKLLGIEYEYLKENNL